MGAPRAPLPIGALLLACCVLPPARLASAFSDRSGKRAVLATDGESAGTSSAEAREAAQGAPPQDAALRSSGQIERQGLSRNHVSLVLIGLGAVGIAMGGLFTCGVKPTSLATIIVYLLSLTMVQLFFKTALDNGYAYPCTMTAMHMMATAVVASCLDAPRDLNEAKATLPVSAVNGLSIALNNASLVYAGVGFVTMVSSCTPATTCLMEGAYWRKRLEPRCILGVFLVCIGGTMCAKGERSYSFVAMLLSVLAATFRSLRAIWQHDLVGAGAGKSGGVALTPVRFTAWSSLLFLLFLAPLALATEGAAPWTGLWTASWPAKAGVAGSTLAAVMLNISQSSTLKYLGPLLQQATGNLQLVAVLLLASHALGEHVSDLQWAGAACIVLGILALNGACWLWGPLRLVPQKFQQWKSVLLLGTPAPQAQAQAQAQALAQASPPPSWPPPSSQCC